MCRNISRNLFNCSCYLFNILELLKILGYIFQRFVSHLAWLVGLKTSLPTFLIFSHLLPVLSSLLLLLLHHRSSILFSSLVISLFLSLSLTTPPSFVVLIRSLSLFLLWLLPHHSHLSLSPRDSSDSLPWSGKCEPASDTDSWISRADTSESSTSRVAFIPQTFTISRCPSRTRSFFHLARSGSWRFTKIRDWIPIVRSGKLQQVFIRF